MNDTILVKLGGSLITDKSKPYTIRENIIKRLSSEIHEAKKSGLIIGHGGGSFPHISAQKYQTHLGIINKQSWIGYAKVANDAARLNRIIVSKLIDAGEKAVSISPSASVICKNSKIEKFDISIFKEYLKNGLLPVIYGDVALDRKNGCCILSTEELLVYLSKKLNSKRIVICGKTDGVFTSDPNINADAELIPEITENNFNEIKKYLSGSDGVADVTGGMLTKVEMSLEAAKYGIETIIINGLKPGNLKRAILNKKVVCTRIK